MTKAEAKRLLRRAVLRRVKAAAADDPSGFRSAMLRGLLRPMLLRDKELLIGIYYPMAHEVDLLPLMSEYPQHRYAFPCCLGPRRMEFRIVHDPARDMAPAAMGIPAPLPHCPAVEPQELDMILVPGVAFTPEGDRLGYGGGYYDNYLPHCTRAQRFALAFAEQLVVKLPTEPHDCRVPMIFLGASGLRADARCAPRSPRAGRRPRDRRQSNAPADD
ncbi:MAG: 5-formyltetrahydrofolate cyclo-ligase [Akkermansia sp.]